VSIRRIWVPTYQYACTECGHELEAVQKFSDDPLTQCPACKGKLRKVFSAVGVVFKGSGFYRTDSRAKSSATDAAAKSGSSGESGGEKSPAKADSASSSKSESGSGSGSAKKSTGGESAA
jgi:putative FmdB family regulatory protein